MKWLKYILISLVVVVPSVITVLIYNDKITQNSPVYYRQGVEFYNNGDYSNAFYNFSKIKSISPLYPAALYKQAKSAQKHADYLTAAAKYELFLKRKPSSILSNAARYNLAKCYYYLKKYPASKAQFLILKQQKEPKPCVEDFYLGLITKQENKAEAALYFKNYLSGVINDEISDKNYLIAAAQELSMLAIELKEEENALIAKAYYLGPQYDKALEYFSKLPVSVYWDYLVIVNHYAGNKIVAKKLIEEGLALYSKNADEDRMHMIYDIYASYMKGTKVNNWTYVLKMVNTGAFKGEDYVMYKLAQILPSEKSLALYNKIVSKYPDSAYAPESLWNIFFSKYLNKEYKVAEQLAHKHLQTYANVNSTTRVMFWLAKVQAKLNKQTEAHNTLSRLASKYTDDYYGLRADSILNKKGDFFKTSVPDEILVSDNDSDFPLSLSNLNIKDFKLIQTIFSLGDVDIWADTEINNKMLESWFDKKRGKKSRSAVIARDEISKFEVKPSFYSAAYKLAYPLYWIDEINIAGKKFSLDPWLILSLIREESYFNEDAISASNAVGLMQLMPSTANYILSKFSVEPEKVKDLTNPRVNMFLGCYYLHYLKERFNNDIYVIAAYNGGEGNVNKWIKSFNTNDYDEFIERIPFEETRNYIKKIFRSYHLYKIIYL